jgi:hyperosmotically inducible protein
MSSRLIRSGLAILALVAVGSVASVSADEPDAWVTTKAKIALLTAKDVSVTAVNVDTVNGRVTLHGKVKTAGEKERAATAVTGIDGVKSVNNLLQVVPEAFRNEVKATDDEVKDHVTRSLKSDTTLGDVKVASVNNGVVLLSGKTKNLSEKLKAIEVAWGVSGVRKVSSEIETEGR